MSDAFPPYANLKLTRARLEHLRDSLRQRGQRPSVVVTGPRTSAELIEALALVEEYGPICEAMYLVMSADDRVVNAEREVLKGALDVLSNGRVRTIHIEAMLDAAARRSAQEGRDVRLDKVIEQLAGDMAKAEAVVVLAAAVAAADARIVPEESAVLDKLFKGLGIDGKRANELVESLGSDIAQ
jgi:tellurite resistance protein